MLWRMLRWSVAATLVLLATGCSQTHMSEFAIYDWETQRATASTHGAQKLPCRPQSCPEPTTNTVYVVGAAKVTSDEIDQDSVRADVDPQVGEPTVFLDLTSGGRTHFQTLTRSLAKRGAEVGTPQHMLIAVDDVVYASPFIDFRRNPAGMPADNGIQLSGATSLAEAERLAKRLRGSG